MALYVVSLSAVALTTVGRAVMVEASSRDAAERAAGDLTIRDDLIYDGEDAPEADMGSLSVTDVEDLGEVDIPDGGVLDLRPRQEKQPDPRYVPGTDQYTEAQCVSIREAVQELAWYARSEARFGDLMGLVESLEKATGMEEGPGVDNPDEVEA